MSEGQIRDAPPSSYILILSGTHVTGKYTVAIKLSEKLNRPWLNGDPIQAVSHKIARAQAQHGYDRYTVFGRTWFTKMQRIGLLSKATRSDSGSGNSDGQIGQTGGKDCLALITLYGLRKEERDAIRDVMLSKSVRTIFVILQITKETLSGRTLGAENPELAAKIMIEKVEDLREPLDEEIDVLVVDSMQDVDALTLDIEDIVRRQVADRT